tara:strand:+ start:572 stop:793 length:222 start_codon:yes stop_codon:yes gene_type:complete
MLFRVPIDRRTRHQTRLCRERQEQAFMEEHGGWAAHMTFKVISTLGELPDIAIRARRKLFFSPGSRQRREILS